MWHHPTPLLSAQQGEVNSYRHCKSRGACQARGRTAPLVQHATSSMPVAAAPPSTALNEHLQFLSSLPAEYIAEFCKAALALLQQKAQGKMFSNAASRVHTWHRGPSGTLGHGPLVRLLTPHRRPSNLVSSGRRWSRECRRCATCC